MGKALKLISLNLILLLFLSTFAFAQQFAPNNQALKGIQQKNPSLFLDNREYNTNLFTGSASYFYEIETPEGIGGLKPQISLDYNHNSYAVDGPVGSGWTLSTPSIYRNINHTRSNVSDDYFYLNLNGINSKLIYDSADGRYHTEQESFFNIRKLNSSNNELRDYWTVKSKDGAEYRFGYLTNSEIKSNLENYVVQWNLDLIKDTHGNLIYYNYVENPFLDIGTSYISNISYNNNLTNIEFVYSLNYSNYLPKYSNGNRIISGARLDSINIKYSNLPVKKYLLNYKDIEYKRFLSSIQEFGSDLVSSLPPTNFSYQELSANNSDFEIATQWRLPTGVYFGDSIDEGVRLVDFNGDGYMDILRSKATNDIEYWRNNGVNGGWTRQSNFSNIISGGFVDSSGGDLGARFLDLNGDARTDILLRRMDPNGALISNVLINVNGTNFSESNFNIPSEIFFALNSSGCNPGNCSSGFEANSYNCTGQMCTLQCTRGTCGPNWNYVYNQVISSPTWDNNDYTMADSGGDVFYPRADKCYEYSYIPSAYNDGTTSECYDLTTIQQFSSYQRSCNNRDINAYAAAGYRQNTGGVGWLTTLPDNLELSTPGTYGFTGNTNHPDWRNMYISNWGMDSTPSSSEWDGFNSRICDNAGYQTINCAPYQRACDLWGVQKCGVGCAGESVQPYIVSGVYETNNDNLGDALIDSWACPVDINDNDYKGSYSTSSIVYTIKEYDYNQQIETKSCSAMIDSGIVPLDINADGRTDIIKSDKNNVRKTWINTGNGFVEDINWVIPTYLNFFNASGSDQGVRFLDVNADGLMDVVKNSPYGNCWFAYNLGNGLNQSVGVILPGYQTFINSSGFSTGVQSVDLNSDGLTDLIRKNGPNTEFYVNNGNGWNLDNRWSSLGQDVRFDKTHSQIIDINADGMVDVVLARDENLKETYINKAQKLYLLKNITNIFGGETSIEYKKISDLNNLGGDSIYDLSFSGWVVSKVTNNNKLGGNHLVNEAEYYDYSGGLFDSKTKEFRGFNYVVQNLSNGAIIKNWFYQDYHNKGLLYKQETTDLDNKIYQRSERVYSIQSYPAGYYFTKLISQNNTDFDYINNSETTRTDYLYDNYGNIIQTAQLGNINNNGDEKYFNKEYVYNLSSWIIDTPKREFMSESASPTSNKLSEIKYYYDGRNYDQAATIGDISKREDWLNTGQSPVTLYSYDSFGNLVNTTNSLGAVTKYVYSSNKLYLVEEINPLGQRTNYDYNERLGIIINKTDSNRFSTLYYYDSFGNLLKIVEPYDSLSEPTKQIEYSFFTRPVGITEKQKEVSGVSNKTYDSYYYYDGFGNEVQVKKDFNGSSFISKNSYYDSSFRKKGESLPYLASNPQYWVPFNITSTNYEYDLFDRVIRFVNFDNTYRIFNYTVNQTFTYDENYKRKDFVYDSYEDIIFVKEYNNGTFYLTKYDYDKKGNLLKITDSKQNEVIYDYDSLNRKVRTDDPDLGVITYVYDSEGNLYSQNYAGGFQINFRYDSLNRLKNKYTSTKNYSYDYDLFTNGTLYRESTNNYSVLYNYDSRLRKINETKTIDGFVYRTSFNYDPLNRPVRISLPNGEIINYNYDENLLVSNITSSASGTPYISKIVYDIYNTPVTISYPNSLQTAYNYSWPNHYPWKISTGNRQKLTYSFDSIGNLVYKLDGITNISSTIVYDDLYRIINEREYLQNGTNLRYDYAYDSISNMLSSSTPYGIFNYSYANSPVAHSPKYIRDLRINSPQVPVNATVIPSSIITAITNIVGVAPFSDRNNIDYDSRGNIIFLLGKSYEYDSFNNLVRAYNSDGPTPLLLESYYYDGSGKLTKKVVHKSNGVNLTTNYIGDLFVETLNSSGRYGEVYYKAGNKLLGQKINGVVNFVHEDYLGSVDVVTNLSGGLVEKNKYDAFGKSLSGGSKTRYDYTGKENDAETGLSYYGARYYSPEFYRFTQPDSVLAEIYDPQQLNRYAYARNNPYKYIDPSGNIIDTVFDVGFIAYDIYTIVRDPHNSANYLSLAADLGGALVPGVTGLGIAVRTAKAGDKVMDLSKTAKATDGLFNRLDNAVKSENKLGAKISKVEYSSLTSEARGAVDLIREGKVEKLRPHPFKNKEGNLPAKKDSKYYTAYDTILGKHNDQRIVGGKQGEMYYSNKHYKGGSFSKITNKFRNYFGGLKKKR